MAERADHSARSDFRNSNSKSGSRNRIDVKRPANSPESADSLEIPGGAPSVRERTEIC